MRARRLIVGLVRALGRAALLSAALAALGSAPALAEESVRRALIIANKNYVGDVGPLVNPHKDAELMRAALEKHGFAVTVVKDADRSATLDAIEDHAQSLKSSPSELLEGEGPDRVGFFYYSGHGVARDGSRNYIVPISATDPTSSRFWHESVSLEEVRETLQGAAPVAAHVVVFDACRDELKLPPERSLSGRGKGFTPVGDRWGGILVAYSTDVGSTASDGRSTDAAGPFASVLARRLARARGEDVETIFARVRKEVYRRTGKQKPWFDPRLDRDVVFGEPGPAIASPPTASAACTPFQEQELYQAAKDHPELRAYFLETCPDSPLGRLLETRAGAPSESQTSGQGEAAPAQGVIKPAEPTLAQKLQALLAAAGVFEGEIDGIWGESSEAALKLFEEKAETRLPDGPSVEAVAALEAYIEREETAASEPATILDLASLPEKYRGLFSPPGELAPGSGQGLADDTIFAPGLRFPLESGPAYVNSQVWGVGGFRSPRPGGQCDQANYSYPWRDNFCETRSYKSALCPAGRGLQGIKLRPSTCEKDKHWAVAVESGVITNLGKYTVTLVGASGREYRYLHLNMDRLAIGKGDRVLRGDRIGLVSNFFGGTPTTIHLHFEIRQVMRDAEGRVTKRFVPPYTSLVDAYVRLLEGTP